MIDIPVAIAIALSDDNRIAVAVIAFANDVTVPIPVTVTMALADGHAPWADADTNFFRGHRQRGSDQRSGRDNSQTQFHFSPPFATIARQLGAPAKVPVRPVLGPLNCAGMRIIEQA
jgi:hypothetical protein